MILYEIHMTKSGFLCEGWSKWAIAPSFSPLSSFFFLLPFLSFLWFSLRIPRSLCVISSSSLPPYPHFVYPFSSFFRLPPLPFTPFLLSRPFTHPPPFFLAYPPIPLFFPSHPSYPFIFFLSVLLFFPSWFIYLLLLFPITSYFYPPSLFPPPSSSDRVSFALPSPLALQHMIVTKRIPAVASSIVSWEKKIKKKGKEKEKREKEKKTKKRKTEKVKR